MSITVIKITYNGLEWAAFQWKPFIVKIYTKKGVA